MRHSASSNVEAQFPWQHQATNGLSRFLFLLFCSKSKFPVQNSSSPARRDRQFTLFFWGFPAISCLGARRISAGKIPFLRAD